MKRGKWSAEDTETLRQLYRTVSNPEIARRLDRDLWSVIDKARGMGLRKPPEFLAAHRFKPAKRQGMSAQNHLPVGSLRVRKHGTLERKVSDDPNTSRRWRAVHLLAWEAANGPIPTGHVVVFKDGCRTTVESEITLDRLELISRAEYSARHNYHLRYPKEVAQLIQLRASLNRKLNRRGTYAQQAQ